MGLALQTIMNRIRKMSYILAATLLALMVGCAPTQSTLPPVEVEAVETEEEQIPEEPEEEEVVVIATGLEEDQEIIAVDDPWTLVAQADRAPLDQAATFLLPAVSAFIDAQQYSLAQAQIARLQELPLDPFQRDNLNLQTARLRQAQDDHAGAIQVLQQLRVSSTLTPTVRGEVLDILADSQIALNRSADAALSLIERDQYLESELKSLNQVRIIEIIGSLDPLSLSILQETTASRLVEGWIVLADVLRSQSSDQKQIELQRWRAIYANHPANPDAITSAYGGIIEQEFKQIALLLPLTSPFGNAAKAFHDGFMASHAQDPSLDRPLINLYDIGEDAFLSSFYYQAAMNEGADFVVGPLGRQAVNSLLNNNTSTLPTLMIGAIPEQFMGPDLYGFSLSPEQEAMQVAERAFADGHRQAGVFRSDSAWGQRVADAFAEHWQVLGGTLVMNKSFPRDITDYSRVIQRLLGIDKSIARHRLLDAQVGTSLEFTPRRRDDIDLLFLAANADQSRLVVPQLRFFQAHNLPLYGTSYIFTGKPNPAVDADLDNVIFGDIDWMIRTEPVPEEEVAETEGSEDETSESQEVDELPLAIGESEELEPVFEKTPYHNTPLDRLYALGYESYRLIPKLKSLRENDWQQHLGKTMRVSVQPDGNVRRELVWATFSDGLPVPLYSNFVRE